jgi:hydroxyacylglutathione hydrolase
VWRYVPDLAFNAPSELRQADPVWVACASGFRASVSAGLLERQGFRPIVLADGGVADVARRMAAIAAPQASSETSGQ